MGDAAPIGRGRARRDRRYKTTCPETINPLK